MFSVIHTTPPTPSCHYDVKFQFGDAPLGEKQNDESEILQQLKEKFHFTSQNSIKVQILTILPKSWSIQKIQTEFGVSNFMARKAKQLVKDKGVLSSADPCPGQTFDNVVYRLL